MRWGKSFLHIVDTLQNENLLDMGFVCALNVGGAGLPKDLIEFLDLKTNPLPEVYAML